MARRLVAADLVTLATGVVRAADPLVVALAAVVAYWARHRSWVLPDLYWIAIAVACVLTINFHQLARVYAFDNLSRLANQIGRLASAWAATILTLIALAYFTQTSIGFSRSWVIGWVLISMGLFLVVRVLFLIRVDRWRQDGRLSLEVAVVGAGEIGRQLIRQLSQHGPGRYRVAGVFDDAPGGVSAIEGYPVIGGINDLVQLAQVRTFDEIVVALPWRDGVEITSAIKKLKAVPVNVKICPDYVAWTLPTVGFQMLGGVPMLAALERPLSGWSLVVKAVEDRVIAGIALALLAPALALIALLIRFDSEGPILFRQKRYGFANNEFTVFKFRTMKHGAGDEAHVPAGDTQRPARHAARRASCGAPASTSCHSCSTCCSGDMSLVGPRPHAVAHNEQYRARSSTTISAAPRQARHHRLGTDQRPARRDRHAREDARARPARPLLHRPLVAAAST